MKLINIFKYHIKKCIFEKNNHMNFQENHRLVCIRLLLSGLLLVIIAIIIHFLFPTAIFSSYQMALFTSVTASAILAAIIFYAAFSIPADLLVDETDNNARNAYILSLLMLFTGLITSPSTANRISNFFFLIGTLSFMAAHILYFIKLLAIRKIK